MADKGILVIEVNPGLEFKKTIDALRIQDKTLPGAIKRRLRAVSKDSTDRVKRAALELPTTGRDHSGLRKRVSRGVRLKINRSATSVRVITTMADPREAVIPRGLDTPFGWRHPVFGTEEVVQQHGYSWFRDTLAEERDNYVHNFVQVLDEARDMIAHAG